jgi:hypothetical protein
MADRPITTALIDTVNHPSHYGGDTVYEHIKVVDAWGLNYALGNATKYICRAGKKVGFREIPSTNAIEDLLKAIWYIRHEIERLELTNTKLSEPHGVKIENA